MKNIIEKIKVSLDIKGIRYIDVFAFSSTMEQIDDSTLRKFINNDRDKIRQQLENWNKEIYESNFARNFKIIFVRCKEFYDEEIDEESRKLSRLNTSITKLMAENINFEILEPLQSMVKDAQKNVNELKNISKKLKELQNEFFTEIKFISDIVGIAMPEPSEIDLLQDKVKNPLQVMEEFKREKGIKTDESIADMLTEMFADVQPVISRQSGGSSYTEELTEILQTICDIAPEDIKINGVYKNSTEYRKIIEQI